MWTSCTSFVGCILNTLYLFPIVNDIFKKCYICYCLSLDWSPTAILRDEPQSKQTYRGLTSILWVDLCSLELSVCQSQLWITMVCAFSFPVLVMLISSCVTVLVRTSSPMFEYKCTSLSCFWLQGYQSWCVSIQSNVCICALLNTLHHSDFPDPHTRTRVHTHTTLKSVTSSHGYV